MGALWGTGSNPALVIFSLFIQNLSKNVPSQFPLWFITRYLYKKVVSPYTTVHPRTASSQVVS